MEICSRQHLKGNTSSQAVFSSCRRNHVHSMISHWSDETDHHVNVLELGIPFNYTLKEQLPQQLRIKVPVVQVNIFEVKPLTPSCFHQFKIFTSLITKIKMLSFKKEINTNINYFLNFYNNYKFILFKHFC